MAGGDLCAATTARGRPVGPLRPTPTACHYWWSWVVCRRSISIPTDSRYPFGPILLPAEIIRPIKEKLQVRCDDISPELFRSALDNGRCLLLCDGLDEVVAGKVRKQLADSLVAFGANSGNRIVIASRPAGLSEVESALFPQFQRCQIERLTWDEVKAFFRFRYGLDKRPTDEQQAAADDLFEQLKANPEALNLATTPLLATMLLRISAQGEDAANPPGGAVRALLQAAR